MSDFRTMVSQRVSTHTIDFSHQMMTVGSCFADAIGSRFQSNKIRTLVNPFGVIYNPLSIHKVLSYALDNSFPPAHTFTRLDDIHLNYDFHSGFSSLGEEVLKKQLSETIHDAHFFLKNTSWIVLTYGTAWVYRRKDNGDVVANCHKQPAASFEKTLLNSEAIYQSFGTLYSRLKEFNPDTRIILTVSPVRHIKDTLELNSVSKSTLRIACHEIAQAHAGVDYYPAYEIMMDDLRDYRFYKRDMLHPTVEAEDYIWQHFINRYGADNFKSFLQTWGTIQQALNHKPFHPDSVGHQLFLRQTLQRLEELKSLVNVEEEINLVRAQLDR